MPFPAAAICVIHCLITQIRADRENLCNPRNLWFVKTTNIMKKNISINLFGTLYAIDEDAYALLEHYLGSMKSYFARQEGGAEIADDIEHRVAELLWERKQQGMEAVNIDTIKSIIAKIGNPEEIENPAEAAGEAAAHATADGSAGGSAAAEGGTGFHYNMGEEHSERIFDRMRARMKNRWLYRDPQNKLLGGVLAGLANYLGTGDPLWWRLGFMVLSLYLWYLGEWALLLPLIYTALWILVPEALSPEDRLRMRGEDVTPESLNAQILSDSATATAQSNYTQPQSGSTALKVLFGAFLAILLFPLGLMLLLLVVFIIMVVSTLGGFLGNLMPFNVAHSGLERVPDFIQTHSTNIWLCIFFGVLAIGIPIYAIVRQLFVKEGNLSRSTKVTMAIVWLLSLVMLIMTLINNATRFFDYMQQHRNTQVDTYIDYDDEDGQGEESGFPADSAYVLDSLPQLPDSVE